MDPERLADEIIGGRRLQRTDDLYSFVTCSLDDLCRGADRIREHYVGGRTDLCSVINGRSGRCPEDCKYCAQSAHNHADCQEYGFLDEEQIVSVCLAHEEAGVHRFSIVTAGRALNDDEFDSAVRAYKAMREKSSMHLCASMGFLSDNQFEQLKDAGVTMYHHNIETSRRNFPNICTTHTYDDKVRTIRRAQDAGLKICSGGIIGMGETWEDRIDMAVSLSELDVPSIPVNVLMPIPGTPLEDMEELTEDDILRTIALFRYINPEAHIRLAAGRARLTGDGENAFRSGASATITGDMLTTAACASVESDRRMLEAMGRSIERPEEGM